MEGQILSAVGVKNAIGITSLSEGVTCLVDIRTGKRALSPFWSLKYAMSLLCTEKEGNRKN